ncbi:MAG: hypothetical protein ACM3NT_09840 [Methylocystaceae bacterium]
MNLELAIAILTQAANYIALVGGYLSQLAAQLVSRENVDRSTRELAEIYNVLGNQITNVSLAMYCIVGQFAIDLVLIQNTPTLADSNTNNNSEDASVSNTNTAEPQRRWLFKRSKKKRLRRWRIIQHYHL